VERDRKILTINGRDQRSVPAAAQQANPHDPPEPFVDARKAAEFLHVSRRRILELARAGDIPAYPLGHGKRRVWRFRLSELACAMQARINCLRQSPAPK
jgi:excisionase family DNA binding protein